MMLKPLTKKICISVPNDCVDRIDKMVFTLPDEFGYPAISELFGCDRYGVVSY